ncbi:hypothetical protein [Paraglaciecola sp.]|uniref:hypothetical protein n=1 Tax=Paraglaciecola sp. TaxID=1920173 RepID=UPI003EF2355C
MKHGIRTKIVNWLTFVALILSLVNWVLVSKVVSTSGDTGIALWAIFMFSFTLVSMPLHGLLLVLVVVQCFIGSLKPIKWLCVYLVFTCFAHVLIANQYGAFDSNPNDPPELTSSELIMLQAFSGGANVDLVKLKQALAQGIDANQGFHQDKVPYLVKAASVADDAAIKLLLEAGADPNKRTTIDYSTSFYISFKQASPLDVVGFSEYGDVQKSIQLLVDAGAQTKDSLLSLGACRKGDLGLFGYVLQFKQPAENISKILVDAKGKTCIHLAIETNQIDFLRAILLEEATKKQRYILQLQVKSNNGQFPLDYALAKKHYRVASIIIEAGGTANQKWSIKRIMDNNAQQPEVLNLKALIKSKGMVQ